MYINTPSRINANLSFGSIFWDAKNLVCRRLVGSTLTKVYGRRVTDAVFHCVYYIVKTKALFAAREELMHEDVAFLQSSIQSTDLTVGVCRYKYDVSRQPAIVPKTTEQFFQWLVVLADAFPRGKKRILTCAKQTTTKA